MNEHELNQKIDRAFSALPPEELPEYILSACTEQKGIIKMKKSNIFLRRILPIAAAFLLVFTGAFGVWQFQAGRAVASTVSLDVNPSIEIKVNKNEKVLAVEPRNEDAKTIIGEMDFKGSNLDVAINALIGSMLQKGYITELANSILISVDNKNAAEAARLQEKLSAEIDNLLHTDTFDGSVLSQTVTASDTLTQQAESNNISTGKAQLINKITELNPQRTFEELAGLSINELNLIISSLQPEAVAHTGTASQKGYIGGDKAKEIALSHAGVAADSIGELEIDLDYEKATMCYELEFSSAGYEYEYDINATTGEVVKNQKNRDDDYIADDPGDRIEDVIDDIIDDIRDDQPITSGTTYITKDAAKSAALSHAGLAAGDIREYEIEFDKDDGRVSYEIEFKSGNIEYSYDIDAITGRVIKSEKDFDD